MDYGLDGRTALVTGGGGRLGREDCHTLAAEGAEVVALDIDGTAAERVAESVREAGGEAHAAECDLTDRADVDEALQEIRERTGGVDVLVNNAAIVDTVAKVEAFDDEAWDRDLSVNLTGTYNVTRDVFPAMCDRGWGRIITMSSMAGWYGGYGQASYASSKAGLVGFGKTLALEGAQHGVTSNVIAPSIVIGDLADLSPEELEQLNPQWEQIRQATPMRELGREEDVAPLVAYLASEQARYVTGQIIGVTGGVDLFTF